MPTNKEINSAIVLANASQLGAEVMMRVSRVNISGNVGGQPLTRLAAAAAVGQAIREKALAGATVQA